MVVYQKGIDEDVWREMRKKDDGLPYYAPYEISSYYNSLIIDNLMGYDLKRSVSLSGNDRLVVLFALAELLGYDLIKKEDNA